MKSEDDSARASRAAQPSTPPPLLAEFQPVYVATEEQAPKVADLLAAKAKDAFFA